MLDALTINRLFNLEAREVTDDAPVILVDDSVSTGPVKLTTHDIARLSRSVAAQLDALLTARVKKPLDGSSLAVYMSNGAEYVPTFLGIAAGRGINCLLNPKYLEPEISFAVSDLHCDALIVSGDSVAPECLAASAKLNCPIIRIIWKITESLAELELLWHDTGDRVEGLDTYNFPDVIGSDIALKLHTSGTTSKPKTVPICHSNIVVTCLNQANTFKWRSGTDRSVLVMPLFHVHGLFNGCIGPLSAGCYVAIPATKSFSKSHIWEDLQKHSANILTAVPSILQIMFLDVTEPVDAVTFRYIRACSSALAPAVGEKISRLCGVSVLESYAMTEATHQMCSNVEGLAEGGSVGFPTGTEIAVIDPATGEIVDHNEPGEICVRGYNVIKGYEGLSAEANSNNFYTIGQLVNLETRHQSFASSTPDLRSLRTTGAEPDAVFQKFKAAYKFDVITGLRRDLEQSPIQERPFLRTGDLGSMSAEGRVKYIGRLKELINRGGEKVSPIEIDAAYMKIAGVRSAAAFGLEDSILGEKVAIAVVAADEAEADLAELAKRLTAEAGQYLSKFKIPVVTYFCSQLPLGPTGKVLRREIPSFIAAGNYQAY